MADMNMEEFESAIAGLKKSDSKTVAMRVNGHHFVFSSIESFKTFALVMLSNAAEFEAQASHEPARPQLRVVN